jgi:3'-phosphoadenosine 5'-phosphosulfate sulfotransferase (PAPS reductase)/FAD synthetase
MDKNRIVIWWSTGAASAVAARIVLAETPKAMLVRTETNNEDPDNYRFEKDVLHFLGVPLTILQSDKYNSVYDVWVGERYMAGIHGASCSRAMKVRPRLSFSKPYDLNVFGYTFDKNDRNRFQRLKDNYPEMKVRAPLIEQKFTKAHCLSLIKRWGIELPRSYAMGFPNANCLQTGCVKAGSPDYWSLYRKHFPEQFAKTAALARELGIQLATIKGERVFIDEIPANWPTTRPIVPVCDFLCQASALELDFLT